MSNGSSDGKTIRDQAAQQVPTTSYKQKTPITNPVG